MDRSKITPEEKAALQLGTIEVGLGSILHAFRVPLRGHVLSLNQGFFLSRLTLNFSDSKAASQATQKVSFFTACLKSLSPAGSRLTPMLAISVQGFLFSLAIRILGIKYIGLFTGMIFICLWAIVQPFFFAWLLYGKNFINALNWALESQLGEWSLFIFIALVAFKILLGITLVIYSKKISPNAWLKYEQQFSKVSPKTPKKKYVLALWWVIATAVMVLFTVFVESDYAAAIWVALRPIGVVFIIYLISKWMSSSKFKARLFTKYPELERLLREFRSGER